MATLSGVATKQGGGAVERVLIRDHHTGELVELVVPDPTGAWESGELVEDHAYSITYLAEGFEPITHTPYFAVGSPEDPEE